MEQSSMSRLLEKLRRAAEVFADPNVENEANDDKVVKEKEAVTQKVESIFNKPHRAAGKLTLKERKFEEDDTSEKKEVFDEDNQGKVPELPDEATRVGGVGGGKKRVRHTVGV